MWAVAISRTSTIKGNGRALDLPSMISCMPQHVSTSAALQLDQLSREHRTWPCTHSDMICAALHVHNISDGVSHDAKKKIDRAPRWHLYVVVQTFVVTKASSHIRPDLTAPLQFDHNSLRVPNLEDCDTSTICSAACNGSEHQTWHDCYQFKSILLAELPRLFFCDSLQHQQRQMISTTKE